MSYHSYTETITANSTGDATVYFGSCITGKVVAVKYMPGTLATGADLTLTCETSEAPILVKGNAGTSDVWFYPKVLMSKNTDGANATDAWEDIHVYGERIKLVVAQGGNGLIGSMTIFTEEGERYLA